MSDARTREMERRSAVGDPEAEVAWIRARLRAGALRVDRLEQLARLGDPLASELVGPLSPREGSLDRLGSPRARDWVQLARAIGHETALAAVAAALRAALERGPPEHRRAIRALSSEIEGVLGAVAGGRDRARKPSVCAALQALREGRDRSPFKGAFAIAYAVEALGDAAVMGGFAHRSAVALDRALSLAEGHEGEVMAAVRSTLIARAAV